MVETRYLWRITNGEPVIYTLTGRVQGKRFIVESEDDDVYTVGELHPTAVDAWNALVHHAHNRLDWLKRQVEEQKDVVRKIDGIMPQ